MAPTHWWELRASLVAVMLAAAPAVASSHPAPSDLEGTYDPETGIFTLTWEYDEATYLVDEYNVYLDGDLLGTTASQEYDDNLTTWTGVMRTYQVTAVVDGDESAFSGELRLVMASTGGSVFPCPPTGVEIIDHFPFVVVVVNPECLPETSGSGSGGGE